MSSDITTPPNPTRSRRKRTTAALRDAGFDGVHERGNLHGAKPREAVPRDRRRGVRVVLCIAVPRPVLGARGDASALARADERARSRAHSLWRASERPVPDHDVSRVGVDVHDGRQGHVHVHRAALLADDVADDARRARGVRGVPDRLRARDGREVRLAEPRDAPALLVDHHEQFPRGHSALHLRAQARDLRRGLHVPREEDHRPAPEIEHARAVRVHLEPVEPETHQPRGERARIIRGGHRDVTCRVETRPLRRAPASRAEV